MQIIKITHRADPEKKCVIDGRTNRQTDGLTNWTDFIGPFPQTWRFDHVFQKFGLILSHNESINARKRNTINIAQGSKSSKTMILSKFM